MQSFDLIVVGGGAAGLMATVSAIRAGKHVLLLEKNSKLGVKILMSGGTRCNITHACDSREIVSAFGKPGKFLHSALATLPPSDVVDLIESVGVKTKIEPGGKIFPVSDRAIDVRDALVQLATDKHQPGRATILTTAACRSITKKEVQFEITTAQDKFVTKSVLITTGGKSYPGCGTTGDGYAWAKTFGHTIAEPVAALTPITNNNFWTHNLKGIAFDQVNLQVEQNHTGEVLDKRDGAFLFTHFGYSGPSALNISRCISKSPNLDDLQLKCDFEPDLNQEQLRKELSDLVNSNSKLTLLNILSRRYPRRFCEALLNSIDIDLQLKNAELGNKNLAQLVRSLKSNTFPISGVYGFRKAEVTAGGVHLDEIDSRTMQSKTCTGLFFAGEVIDLDGPIGGYNFQCAFSTGWLAGIHS